MFYYPEEAAKQYTVNKFDDAEKGGQGLAEMVKGVADESIKARTGPCQNAMTSATEQGEDLSALLISSCYSQAP